MKTETFQTRIVDYERVPVPPCVSRRHSRRQGDSPACFDLASAAAGLGDFEPSVTRQEFKDDADLNILLARYGAIPQNLNPPMYGDFNTDTDLVTAYEAVQTAKDQFASLPPSIRKSFGSWAKLAEAIATGEYNLDAELEKLHPKPDGTVAGVPPDAGTPDPAGATPPPDEKPKA